MTIGRLLKLLFVALRSIYGGMMYDDTTTTSGTSKSTTKTF